MLPLSAPRAPMMQACQAQRYSFRMHSRLTALLSVQLIEATGNIAPNFGVLPFMRGKSCQSDLMDFFTQTELLDNPEVNVRSFPHNKDRQALRELCNSTRSGRLPTHLLNPPPPEAPPVSPLSALGAIYLLLCGFFPSNENHYKSGK